MGFENEKVMKVIGALEDIVSTDETLAKSAIGMLIDMICARYGGNPVELAEDMAGIVRHVNGTLGEFS